MKRITGKSYAYPCIRNMDSFITQSKNFRAEWDSAYDEFPNISYKIFSYRTCIAQWSEGVWYINDAPYSSETSKHREQIYMALGHKFLDDNAIHINYSLRGILDLRRYVSGDVALERIARIKRESLQPGEGNYYRQYISWGGKHEPRFDYV